MRKIILFTATPLLLLAQTAAQMTEQGLALQRQGDFKSSLPLFRNAAALHENNPGAPAEALPDCLNNLAIGYVGLSDWKQAEVTFLRAAALFDERFGVNDVRVAPTLENLALIHIELGQLADADSLLQRSLELYKKHLPTDSRHFIMYYQSRGRLELARGNYVESANFLEKARALGKKKFGPNHPLLGRTLSLLAQARIGQGNYARAESHWREAIAIGETNHDPITLIIRLERAQFLMERRNWDAAVQLLETDREEISKRFGATHTTYALALCAFGRARTGQGRWEEAKALLSESLAVYQANTGLYSDQVAIVNYDLGLLHMEWKRPKDARPYFELAIAAGEKALGPNHASLADYLFAYSESLRVTGKRKEAAVARRRGEAIRAETGVPAGSPHFIDVRSLTRRR